MATLGRFQSFATDDAGNVLTSPSVDVVIESSGLHASLFSDRAGATPIANPFTGASDGLCAFHVIGGAYKVTITKGAVTRTFRYVGVGTASEHDTNVDATNNTVPPTDDGASLGTTALKFADLFLANGATINFNSGNVVLTHSTGLLTLAGSLTLSGGSLSSRIKPRLSSAASGDISPDISATDMYIRTALSAAIAINAPIGTPVNGERLTFRFKDNGTARALTWNGIFRALNVTIPTTTVISKTLYVAAIYNSDDTKWDVVAVNNEA
jgi:hypothetical protein